MIASAPASLDCNMMSCAPASNGMAAEYTDSAATSDGCSPRSNPCQNLRSRSVAAFRYGSQRVSAPTLDNVRFM